MSENPQSNVIPEANAAGTTETNTFVTRFATRKLDENGQLTQLEQPPELEAELVPIPTELTIIPPTVAAQLILPGTPQQEVQIIKEIVNVVDKRAVYLDETRTLLTYGLEVGSLQTEVISITKTKHSVTVIAPYGSNLFTPKVGTILELSWSNGSQGVRVLFHGCSTVIAPLGVIIQTFICEET